MEERPNTTDISWLAMKDFLQNGSKGSLDLYFRVTEDDYTFEQNMREGLTSIDYQDRGQEL